MQLRDIRYSGLECHLNLSQRRDGHPQGQVFVEHMVFAHIAVGQHIVAELLGIAQTRAVAEHDPGMGAQHGNMVGNGFGIRRANADIDHADAAAVSAHQMVGRHLRQTRRQFTQGVLRQSGRADSPGEHIAGLDKSHILAVGVGHGLMA